MATGWDRSGTRHLTPGGGGARSGGAARLAATEEAGVAEQAGVAGVRPHGRGRTVAAWALTVAAVLATVLALLAVWTFRTFTDSELFVERVGPVVEDPLVAQAVADSAAAQLVEAVGLQERVESRLPPELAPFSVTIAGAAETTLAREGAEALQTEQFRSAFEAVLLRGHQLSIGVLSGQDTDNVSNEAGVIVLDVAPAVVAVAEANDGLLAGLIERRSEATGVDIAADPVGALEARLGVDLPDDFGQVVLFESENLAAAQTAYTAARVSVWLAPLVALVLVAAAVLVSRRRLRTLLHVVVGVAGLLVLVRLAAEPVRSALVGAVAESGLAGAVASSFDTVLSSLFLGIAVVAALGVAALVALLLLGRADRRQAGAVGA
jgi:hypothetical protein